MTQSEDHIARAAQCLAKWHGREHRSERPLMEYLLASIAHSLIVSSAAAVEGVGVEEFTPGGPGIGWIRTESGTPGQPDNVITYTRRAE